MAADASTRFYSPSYFKSPNIIICFLVGGGMLLCHLACYRPHLVPEDYLSVLRPFYHFVVHTHPIAIQVIYHAAVLVHILEALYSIKYTLNCGITDATARLKWFVQTVLFGSFSLILMKGNLCRKKE